MKHRCLPIILGMFALAGSARAKVQLASPLDVVVGEVWLASGQSNMDFSMDFRPHNLELMDQKVRPNE